MKEFLNVYEYEIKGKRGLTYTGSFTLKSNADKSVVRKLKAHKVDTFEMEGEKQ